MINEIKNLVSAEQLVKCACLLLLQWDFQPLNHIENSLYYADAYLAIKHYEYFCFVSRIFLWAFIMIIK